MTATDQPPPNLLPHNRKTAPRRPPLPQDASADAVEEAAPPRDLPRPLAAQRLSLNELSGFGPVCSADDCLAPAEEGSIRTIGGERWFTCANGHLNAELICTMSEAA